MNGKRKKTRGDQKKSEGKRGKARKSFGEGEAKGKEERVGGPVESEGFKNH